MKRRVRWTTRATTQLQEAAAHLESKRRGAGPRLVDQVEEVLMAAAANPRMFPCVPGVEGNEVRRGLIFRYRYWVIYEIEAEALLVLAVWHGARNPAGWNQA